MVQRDPAFCYHAADEQTSVTVAWVLLAAHHRDAGPGEAVHETVEPALEEVRISHEVVPNVTFRVVKPVGGRAAAEVVAEEDVLD